MPGTIAAFPEEDAPFAVEDPDAEAPALLEEVVAVVAAPLVGDDAPVLAAGALEPEAVPFKQLVLPPD